MPPAVTHFDTEENDTPYADSTITNGFTSIFHVGGFRGKSIHGGKKTKLHKKPLDKIDITEEFFEDRSTLIQHLLREDISEAVSESEGKHEHGKDRFREVITRNHNVEDQMVYEVLRLISFQGIHIETSQLQLAASGFYATGDGDETRCFSCRVTHRHWRRTDNPFIVHIRISPTCTHATATDERNVSIQNTNMTEEYTEDDVSIREAGHHEVCQDLVASDTENGQRALDSSVSSVASQQMSFSKRKLEAHFDISTHPLKSTSPGGAEDRYNEDDFNQSIFVTANNCLSILNSQQKKTREEKQQMNCNLQKIKRMKKSDMPKLSDQDEFQQKQSKEKLEASTDVSVGDMCQHMESPQNAVHNQSSGCPEEYNVCKSINELSVCGQGFQKLFLFILRMWLLHGNCHLEDYVCKQLLQLCALCEHKLQELFLFILRMWQLHRNCYLEEYAC